MISVLFARLIRAVLWGPLAAHLFVHRHAVRFAGWLEDERPLDRPLPWLCGIVSAVLLWWLVHHAWK